VLVRNHDASGRGKGCHFIPRSVQRVTYQAILSLSHGPSHAGSLPGRAWSTGGTVSESRAASADSLARRDTAGPAIRVGQRQLLES
jgi:hypothetical protein